MKFLRYLAALCLAVPLFSKMTFKNSDGAVINFGVIDRIDMLVLEKNVNTFNSCAYDTTLYTMHTFDILLDYSRPSKTILGCDCDGLEEYTGVAFKVDLRNKAVWGAPEANGSTVTSTIKIGEAVTGNHDHPITLGTMIVRELWIELAMRDVMHLSFDEKATFKMGFFPFQVGRGISLGDAYATTPDLLGYNPVNAVQQFAPGFKLSGRVSGDDLLRYDAYLEIVQNRASSFKSINERILGQEFSKRYNSARGTGVFNSIFSARVVYIPRKDDYSTITLEPYLVADMEDEQKIDFLGDATARLATLGMAFEVTAGCVDFNAEFGFNFGSQRVKAWDRNTVLLSIRSNGYLSNDYSKVTAIESTPGNPYTGDVAGKKALYTPDNIEIVSTSPRFVSQNGQQIGDSNLKNASDRFRAAYTNWLRGKMAVADIRWRLQNDWKLAAAVGYASGGQDPNHDLDYLDDSQEDGTYTGFVSLQERYVGKWVRSSFMMSGVGRVPRVLSFPADSVTSNRFPSTVSRFSNLIYTGVSAWGTPQSATRKINMNPNIMAFWQAIPSRLGFNSAGQPRYASKFLGAEFNLFVDTQLFDGLTFFITGGFFIPGQHYKDIAGVPLNRDQAAALDQLDQTGVLDEAVPFTGKDPAYFIDAGITYKF